MDQREIKDRAASLLQELLSFGVDAHTIERALRGAVSAALTWYPIATAPTDGTPILVSLTEEFQGSVIHAASFDKDFRIIGGYFEFDVPPATHWAHQPAGPAA